MAGIQTKSRMWEQVKDDAGTTTEAPSSMRAYAHARTRRPTREAEGCEARREMEHGGKGAPSSTSSPPAPPRTRACTCRVEDVYAAGTTVHEVAPKRRLARSTVGRMVGVALRLRSRCDIAVRSDEARAVTGCGEAESGPAPSQRS